MAHILIFLTLLVGNAAPPRLSSMAVTESLPTTGPNYGSAQKNASVSQVAGVNLACNSRDFDKEGTVCVCSKKNCDSLPPVSRLRSEEYEIYTSSLAGARFNKISGSVSNSNLNSNYTISINRDKRYQKINGFGGAFTDSAGLNILSLSEETQETLMNAYFSENGLQYSMGRIPIGGTDFSTRVYSYDDVENDFDLKYFSLQDEDLNYKIPLIKKALNLTNNNFKLFGTAWSAPPWMKTNKKITGIGFLNLTMYDVWANYHIKFLDAYREKGINFWGLTTGNEPANALNEQTPVNDMAWTPFQLGQYIAQHLGPKIRLNQYYADLKIITVDDQRVYFPWIARSIMQNQVAKSFVDGFSVHYYTDNYVSADVLTLTHVEYPDKFILAVEACEDFAVNLGPWERAENYLNSIIDNLNNWSTGWLDWNLALDMRGGPNHFSRPMDSPILVNKAADEFYKQPMFYAVGHFSKFLRPDSVRISSISTQSVLKHVAFQRPDGGIVVSLFNPTDNAVSVTIQDISINNNNNNNMNIYIAARSINSIVYW